MPRWVTPNFAIASSSAGGLGLLDRRRGGAEAQREHRRDAEAEGEGHRRAGQENVAGLRPDEMLGERVARGEDVAVELDAALGDAGRAAGEGDDARIVAAGVDGRQRLERGGAGLQLAAAVIAVIFDDVLDAVGLVDGLAEVADEAAVDDRVADLRALDHRRDLARAKQRHGRDDDAAGLQHAEPGGEDRVAVGPAQEHAVAGDQALFLDQQARDAAAEIVEVGIGPAAMLVDDRERVGAPPFSNSAAAFSRSGYWSSGRSKRNSGSSSGGGSRSSTKRVAHQSSGRPPSFRSRPWPRLSTRPFTSTSAIAG